jgi:hypothetical protein
MISIVKFTQRQSQEKAFEGLILFFEGTLEGLLKSPEFIQRQLAHFAGGKENEIGQTKQIGSCAAPGSAQNAVYPVAIFHSFSQLFFFT